MLCIMSVQGVHVVGAHDSVIHRITLSSSPVLPETLHGYSAGTSPEQSPAVLGQLNFDRLPQDQTRSFHVCFQPQLQPPLLRLHICHRLKRKLPSLQRGCPVETG